MIWLLIVAFLVGWVLVRIFSWRSFNKKWLTWPTVEEYWAEHPDCKTDTGIKCYKCGSLDTKALQFTDKPNQYETKMLQRCCQCRSNLYRTGEI